MEKLTEERDQRTAAENREKEQNKRLQRQLRDTKEEMGELARKEAEASRKKHELVMQPNPRGAPHPHSGAEWLLCIHLPAGRVGDGPQRNQSLDHGKEEERGKGDGPRSPEGRPRAKGGTRVSIQRAQACSSLHGVPAWLGDT